MNAGSVVDMIALVAVAMIFYGCYLVAPALAWIVVGAILLTLCLFAARSTSRVAAKTDQQENTGG